VRPDLTRRRLLTAGATLGLTATAGCAGVLGSDARAASVHRLLVENRTGSPHTVHLQLLDDGDLAYWRSVDVPVSTPEADVVTGTALAPGFPTGSGQFTLRARLDDEPDWRRIDFGDTSVPDGACFELVVTVEDSDTLGFLSSVDEAVCDKPSG